MKLHEYQSKMIFAQYGIPHPYGKVAATAEQAKQFAEDIGSHVMIKAQTFAQSRSLSGGFLFAGSPEEARQLANKLLNSSIGGYIVHQVLVEEVVQSASEVYIAITNDRTIGKPVLVAANQSGVEIHEVIRSDSEHIGVFKEIIEPLIGLREYQIRRVVGNLYVEPEQWAGFQKIVSGLYRCYIETDATLAEINPLAVLDSGQFLALDGKLYIDDNALYRQPAIAAMRDIRGEMEGDMYTHEVGIIYHHLDGQIGCMVNGAGLAMTVIDLIHDYGGGKISPANFLDIGGGSESRIIQKGLQIILANPQVQVVLINIFGGVTRCDEVAAGIIHVWKRLHPEIPLIVRLQGTGADLAQELLTQSGIAFSCASSLTDAVTRAVQVVQNQGKVS